MGDIILSLCVVVGSEICSVAETCGMCSLSGLVVGISCGLVVWSMFTSFGAVCVCGCGFGSIALREEVAIGSVCIALGGVVGFLGEARPSVVESSECSGVVGSVGPCIYSCGGVSWVVSGLCSACVASVCSCIVLIGWGWSESDDDGANWHHGHNKNGSSSGSIIFLHAWCMREGQALEPHCSSV